MQSSGADAAEFGHAGHSNGFMTVFLMTRTPLRQMVGHLHPYPLLVAAALALAACAGEHSPDVYAADAVQQANKVEPGVVVGFRQVTISASGKVGAVTGGAAGGILGGSQAGSLGVSSALGAVGGTAIGGIIGNTIERVAGDTTGWEYMVRKPDGGMLSLTQREPKPIPVGQKVLVITGSQARIVADYAGVGEPQPAPAPNAPAITPAPAKEAPTVKDEGPTQLTPPAPPPVQSAPAPAQPGPTTPAQPAPTAAELAPALIEALQSI
jgi:outer membrane lipoprotein SlyB